MQLEPIIAPRDPGGETLRAIVRKVFDGDGFLAAVQHPERDEWLRCPFRIAYIDAPEMGQPGGPESKEFLSSLILDQPLELVPITSAGGGPPIDRHRRLLCVPYLLREHGPGDVSYYVDGRLGRGRLKKSRLLTRNIELEMILNGWAWVIERYGPDDEYLDALSDAQRHRRGIWAMDDNIAPWIFKLQQRRARKLKPGQADLFAGYCPQTDCDGQVVRRDGARGPFLGCSNFPKCRYSRDVAD